MAEKSELIVFEFTGETRQARDGEHWYADDRVRKDSTACAYPILRRLSDAESAAMRECAEACIELATNGGHKLAEFAMSAGAALRDARKPKAVWSVEARGVAHRVMFGGAACFVGTDQECEAVAAALNALEAKP